MKASQQPLVTRVARAAHLGRNNPVQLLKLIGGRWTWSYVFAASLVDIPEPVCSHGTVCRPLSDADVNGFPHDGNPARLQRLGVNSAYGVFVADVLAHVSWMIAPEVEPLTGGVIGLRASEIEVSACFTHEDFRGLGLYPLAIRFICHEASAKGFFKVYMKTTPNNKSSQHGILKAGLRRVGTALSYDAPWLPVSGTTLRLHRLHI
jgi:hypothetical protein